MPHNLCHCPVNIRTFPAPGSLVNNVLCGINFGGEGTYTAEGINKLCETIKANTSLTSLK